VLRPDGPATIDMTEVTFVDSTFLHALAALKIRFKEQTITLLIGSENIRHLLRIVRFDRLFEIVDIKP